jgi:hypothetical protein
MHAYQKAHRAHTPACHCALRVLLKICSIEHTQDSLVQACAVISVGVSDIGMATYHVQQKGTICDTRGLYRSI